MNQEIIPITQDPHDAAITALVLAKRSQSVTALAQRPDLIDEQLRAYYEQAQQAGLIILVNTAIRTLGQQSPPGIFEWVSGNGRSLTARYNASTGITIVQVGDLKVLTNEDPHACALLPGDWMHYLNDCYKALARESAWQVEIEKTRQDTKKVGDFLADV